MSAVTEQEKAGLDMPAPKPDRLAGLNAGDRLSVIVALLIFGCLALVPLLPGQFWTYVATEILILGLFAMSFNLLHGYMGQISFGHAAFFGLGAYTTAMLIRYFKDASGSGEIGYAEFFFSLVAAPPIAAAGALVVGYFCVRLTGIYFAILTLAFGELAYYIVFSWYSFTKGDDGVQGLLPPRFFQDPVNYYYFTMLVVGAALVLMWRIVQSPFGYSLRNIRDNQRRTAFLGINVRAHMLVNFVTAGAFAGVAGALWAPFQRSVAPGLLGWQESGIAVFMALIGGTKYFIGPIVGSIVYTFLHAWVTTFTVYWPLTIGIVILLIVLFAPGGV
ncbi:MAG: branched-chain amino acid ABC transporter permease, partial [Pseudorhodoplanes sp.]